MDGFELLFLKEMDFEFVVFINFIILVFRLLFFDGMYYM